MEEETPEDFLAKLKRIHEGPWFKRVWYYRVFYLKSPWRKIKDAYYGLVSFWQRGKRGWAISDTWHGDVYLARVISEMCAYLKAHNYTTPWPFYEDEENGNEHWVAYLEEMEQAFGAYVAYMDLESRHLDKNGVLYPVIIERMRALFDHYSSLND